MAHINKGLLFAQSINANLAIDGAIKSILRQKISPALRDSTLLPSTEVFKEILERKGIPDLGALYIQKVLSIDDILELRNNFDGRKFRDWFHDIDYNADDTLKELLNRTNSSNHNKILKVMRFLSTNAVGCWEPVAGFVASFVDSFVIDKFIKGWHPSIFLDKRIQTKIDERMRKHELEQKRKSFLQRYSMVGRNDPCPCGSDQKFKKCHGKLF